MKLERISENQIRCTLNKEDLSDRELRISELAYGTEKAKELFRDMMQQASYELGFEAEDIPLMIEAIPVSQDSLVLIITKVEDPDELDTRFSKFSSDDDVDEYEYEADTMYSDDLLPTFADPAQEQATHTDKDFIPLSEAIAPHKIQPEQNEASNSTSIVQAVRIFSFPVLEDVIAMAAQLHHLYHGSNSLYKDTDKNRYYLIMSKDDHTLEEFNRICNLASEFGQTERSNYATLSYYEEHFEVVTKTNAIEMLSQL